MTLRKWKILGGAELFEPVLSTVVFGNEASLTAYYQSAAFLVMVSEFTSQRGSAMTSP